MPITRTTITDNQGDTYTLSIDEDENGIDLNLYVLRPLYRGRIGRLLGVLDAPDTLQLHDIIIWDPPSVRPRGFGKLLGWRFWPRRVGSYRHRGLGSQMLQTLIDRARQRGVKLIYGLVMDKDPDNPTSPLPWYQRHGFQIIEHREEHHNTLICLELIP